MTPISGPVPMRAGRVIRPLSIAGGLPRAYALGEPNAVCRCCTRSGAPLPIPWPQAGMRIAQYSGTHTLRRPWKTQAILATILL